MEGTELLRRMAAAWGRGVNAPARVAFLLAALATVAVGAHVARLGTPIARLGVASGLVLVVAVGVLLRFDSARVRRSSRLTIERVLGHVDRPLAERALRALGLVEATLATAERGSPELARAHYEALLARASLDSVLDSARRRGAALWRAALAAAGVLLLASLAGPFSVLEGLNVLVAHDGVAPLPMLYLRGVRVLARPPAYLGLESQPLAFEGAVRLPRGTELTVRGYPLLEGRQLVLRAGQREEPLTDDGTGAVVAHLTVDESVSVSLGARHGDVLVLQGAPLGVLSLADEPARVSLDGAPMRVELAQTERIELRWSTSDDHGLRQVDLVLRSGNREERRNLSHYDGETASESGAHVLFSRDAFLRRSYLPVEISIEVRDNNPLPGAQWGRSAPVTAVPPEVGAPERRRFDAIQAVHQQLIALLGALVPPDEVEPKPTPAERAARRAELEQQVDAIDAALVTALGASYGGLSVAKGFAAFASGQLDRVRRGVRHPKGALPPLEDAILGLDAALTHLGARDAADVAKALGDVAEEATLGAKLARDTEQRTTGLDRLDASLDVLRAGVGHLDHLGSLGSDLAEVARASLGRIARVRTNQDLFHTELAAEFLAERLRRPSPSFGAKGSGKGGVESGGGSSDRTPSQGGPASDSDGDFDQMVDELRRLTEDHAAQIQRTEQTIERALEQVDKSRLGEEAGPLAEKIREAVAPLPEPGVPPGTPAAAAALAREHARAMAHALETLDLAGALESAERALESFAAAERLDQGTGAFRDPLSRGGRAIEEALAWARRAVEAAAAQASEAARTDLERLAEVEKELAKRARELASRAEETGAGLPEEQSQRVERAENAMQEAMRGLEQGQGPRALERQREAQRLLEQSDQGKTSDQAESDRERPRPSDDGDGKRIQTGGEVPGKTQEERAEEFRKRVLRGLGRSKSERLSPAVKRYAEGLLR